jgi:hypothetical protein
MANWSDNTINLYGEAPSIEAAHNYLMEFCIKDNQSWIDGDHLKTDDSVNQRGLYEGGELLVYTKEPNLIEISINGRWSGPSGLFIYLIETFKLSGTYVDREQGCNFTHVIEAVYGEILSEDEDDYISDLAFQYIDHTFIYEELEYIIDSKEALEEHSELLAVCERNGIDLTELRANLE